MNLFRILLAQLNSGLARTGKHCLFLLIIISPSPGYHLDCIDTDPVDNAAPRIIGS